jgi:hypothetical protein
MHAEAGVHGDDEQNRKPAQPVKECEALMRTRWNESLQAPLPAVVVGL